MVTPECEASARPLPARACARLVREILPVVEVDGERVADGKPGPVTRRLHAAFRAKVGVGADPMPWE